MSKIRQTTLILGEGITEFFFLNSLKDDYSALRTVKPDYPKNTSRNISHLRIGTIIKHLRTTRRG